MNRLDIAMAMLPWFAENSASEPGKTWQQVAVGQAFELADMVLQADQSKEPKKQVLMYARDCRTCARVVPGPDWNCASVYTCTDASHYVASQPVKRWEKL